MGLGWQELVIILVIVVIIFGADKLPKVGSDLGQAIRSFKEFTDNTEGIEERDSDTSSAIGGAHRDAHDRIVERTADETDNRSIRADDV